jgi:hypothetical protein
VKHREPCGCTHDGHRWLQECEAHAKEENERHERVALEHREANRAHNQPEPRSWVDYD